MTRLVHELRTRQQITLTPRLQQSVKLLQMSTLDFTQEIAQAISENPFLEDPDDSLEADENLQTGGAAPDVKAEDRKEETTPDTESEYGDVEVEHIEALPDDSPSYPGDYPGQKNNDQPANDLGQWISSTTSMQDVLHRNLCGMQLSDRDQLLIEYIIDALDDDGYLRMPFDELAPTDAMTPAASDNEWEVALRLVQQLGNPGVGARNLAECLELQLAAANADDAITTLAIAIVREGLQKLARADYESLAAMTGHSTRHVREACTLIRSLDPRPGASYATVDASSYIIPDVIVRRAGGIWVAIPNRDATPRARLNTRYAELFRQTRYADRKLMAQALQEARWLMRSLEQRNSTIQRVAEAIVDRQQTWFDYGDVALRPMMLSEIADELEMHESTISRATSHKYMATPKGIVEFKHFFSRELATQTGGTLSAAAVRALIQEMIDNEDPTEPLSDVVLAQRLTDEGIVVARRTVSKYRAQIKYPAAELRRHA